MKISKPKWHIVVTEPQREQKVAQLLTRKKIKAFCPMNLSNPYDDDETETVQKQEPLFPNFVFVLIEEKDRKHLKSIAGVIDFVYWLNKPVIVQDDEINFLETYASGCFFLQKRKTAVVENGAVEVSRGSNVPGQSGQLNLGFNSIQAYLPSMGYQILTELTTVNFGVIKKDLESQAST